jgi:Cu-processing system ATP-binding protein
MIAFRGFGKRYGDHDAVCGLTLDVRRGEAVALLGPNGSGKTTSIKAAAGLVRPTTGDVLLGEPGRPATDHEARRIVSFLPQRTAFPEALTGREVVEFFRRLRDVAPARTDAVLKFAALNGSSNRPVATYSGGMLQRLGLAVAMLPESPVLLLDEPTAALDPDGTCAFYGVLDARRNSGATVFFSSHQMGDVERLADRYAVLVEGRLVADLTHEEMSRQLADRGVMRVRLARHVADLLNRVRERAPRALEAQDELIVPGPAADRPAILDLVRSAGAVITGLTAEEGRLDALYRELVAKHS